MGIIVIILFIVFHVFLKIGEASRNNIVPDYFYTGDIAKDENAIFFVGNSIMQHLAGTTLSLSNCLETKSQIYNIAAPAKSVRLWLFSLEELIDKSPSLVVMDINIMDMLFSGSIIDNKFVLLRDEQIKKVKIEDYFTENEIKRINKLQGISRLRKYRDIYYDSIHVFARRALKFEYRPLVSFRETISGIARNSYFADYLFLEPLSPEEMQKQIKRRIQRGSDELRDENDLPILFELRLKALNEIISRLNDEDIELVLIGSPLHPELLKKFTDQDIKLYDKLMPDLDLDLKYDESMFHDPSHVNVIGRARFAYDFCNYANTNLDL